MEGHLPGAPTHSPTSELGGVQGLLHLANLCRSSPGPGQPRGLQEGIVRGEEGWMDGGSTHSGLTLLWERPTRGARMGVSHRNWGPAALCWLLGRASAPRAEAFACLSYPSYEPRDHPSFRAAPWGGDGWTHLLGVKPG